MERKLTATVFESENSEEVTLVQAELSTVGILSNIEEGKTNSLGIPVENTLYKITVHLKDEVSAFDIIDQYFQEKEA